MRRRWSFEDARAHLRQVVRDCADGGAQEITAHGKTIAVVLSSEDFRRLRAKKASFVEFVRNSPLMGSGLNIKRDHSPVRRVEP